MPVETGFSVTFAIKAANQYGSAMKGNVGSRQVWGFFVCLFLNGSYDSVFVCNRMVQ